MGTFAQWRAAGVTAAQFRSLVRHGYLIQVRRGAYATRRAVAAAKNDPCRTHALHVAAVCGSLGQDVVASHQSAALIYGFDLLKRPSAWDVTLTCQPSGRRRSRATAGILFHTAKLPAEHVSTECGAKVTTAARTVVDLARTLPFMEAVVVADSALRTSKTTRRELERVVDACGRRPGIGQARHVVAFSDGRAESALESCARVTFDTFGLEPPEIQVTIRGPGFVFRVDFCWTASKTIAEADGLAKYAVQADLLAQFRRDRLLRDAGYKVVHFTWRELLETPDVVVARVRSAMCAASPY